MAQDVVIETLDTLIALLQKNGGVLLPAHRGEAERIVRAAWGGERSYIGKLGEDGQAQLSARDRAIRREFQRGASPQLLARRHGLSKRRVLEIVQSERQSQATAESPAAASFPQIRAESCLTGRTDGDDAAHQRPPARANPKARATTT